MKNGGARRNRTDDLLHAMQALSQLSYSPETFCTVGPVRGAETSQSSRTDQAHLALRYHRYRRRHHRYRSHHHLRHRRAERRHHRHHHRCRDQRPRQ